MIPLNCLPPSRLGLHYFPDTLHYREADLQAWLPVLQELCAGWLVLRAEPSRAIPEHFIRGLKKAGIEPLIQFRLPLGRQPDLRELNPLLEVYADWGASYVLLFDRPNARASWSASGWVQQELVERFLDRYIPVATAAQKAGLTPVFPTLEPGGSYWDTAFLRSALQGMQRRKQDALLQNLVLSAYAWQSGGQSLDWGGGGPERWPQARPYHTPEGSQDQRGFRIFDWYLAVANSVLPHPCSILLLQAGQPCDPGDSGHTGGDLRPAKEETVLNITRLLDGETVMDPLEESNVLDPIPSQVIGCNFWLLSAGAKSPHAGQGWFQNAADAAEKTPLVAALTRRQREHVEARMAAPGVPVSGLAHAIRHYLLLPGAEWGVSDWYLEVIRPFVKKHKPTVGFSVEEAVKAARVTVVGGNQHYPEDLLERLQKAGCRIEQINGDGTNIASQLAER